MLREFAELPTQERSQRLWPIDHEFVYLPQLQQALRETFHGHCAYCGSPADPGEVSRHRPPEEALNLDRSVSPDHYWWLSYDWANLLFVCTECHNLKGSRFPVEAKRAPAESRGADLDVERPLLLDPYRDRPEWVFTYDTSGFVVGVDDRAATTVEVLALNRPGLLFARSQAAAEVDDAIHNVTPRGDGPGRLLSMLLGEDQPYLGIRRWIARRALHETGAPREWFDELGLDDPNAMRLATGDRLPAAPPPIQKPSDVEDLDGARLSHVTIRNFKVLKELSLSFPKSTSKREPWLLLVGNNGVGKSTALKAIALAMVDDKTRARLVPDASACVRSGTSGGSITLRFSDGAEVVLRFRRDSSKFEVAGAPPRLLVLGYGPTRLPPTPDHPSPPADRVRVENLFDPFVPLSDAEKWLADTKAVPTKQFNLHARDLKRLLPVDEKDRLNRRAGKLYAQIDGNSTPLPDLSDGFRSVLAMATDMTMQLSSYWDSMRTAEAFVLIDEIEVHLHPQWRMGIVPLLREVFPRLHVIVTTHDPLCLQETDSGEVIRLEKADGGRVAAIPLDVPRGLRADQLLTGEWFRLTTTTDNETARLRQEHSRLLLEPQQTSAVRSRRAELEQILRERANSYPETSVERLAEQVVGQIAAEEAIRVATAPRAERERLASLVLDAVRERRK
ncbi:AAA family ATPase [Nocardioides pinisoli]|uniref:AAA family ATPase n=1 Tax=Nocardioides pinisoli TaxID=2950279 RepID=A0ABT1KRF1_9ACTN|nr:AAA family ATPase [Nocardioides pinisoli]MCP3420320.1 AAA family ATPase [Nocardioides pinisoli]